ncbi:MAG: gamma-glutamyl-gamma-aminobutyrate hydrolase family protein [Limisphaerales bacterium]
MRRPPLILIAPDVDQQGPEFGDLSISLSVCYPRAILDAGGLPMLLPPTVEREAIADCVSRSDGVLLTGGGDVEPRLHTQRLPRGLRRTVTVCPDGGQRDLRELLLIDEVFRQRKPLMAICRGHQMLNVALGGALLIDIPGQLPKALNHHQMDRKGQVVHEVRLTPDSLLAKITGTVKLGVNSTHHQAVAHVAGPLRAVALSSDDVVEGLEFKPWAAHYLPFLLSVQFHPERLAQRSSEHRALFRAFIRACVRSRNKFL